MVGSATPDGQCQWSTCGSQAVAAASVVSALAEFAVEIAAAAVAEAPFSADSAGGVVGSATPEGQCLEHQLDTVLSRVVLPTSVPMVFVRLTCSTGSRNVVLSKDNSSRGNEKGQQLHINGLPE